MSDDAIHVKAQELLEACELEREKEDARHSLRLAKISNVEASAQEILDSAPQASPPQAPAEPESGSTSPEDGGVLPEDEAEAPTGQSIADEAVTAEQVAANAVGGKPKPKPEPPKRVGLSDAQREKAEQQRKDVIAYVAKNPGCNQTQISDDLDIPRERVRALVQNLTRKGDLRATGSTKNRVYFHRNAPLTKETPPRQEPPEETPEPPEAEEPPGDKAQEDEEPEPPKSAPLRNGRPGPKTDMERSVVAELERKNEQTAAGLGVKLKLTEKKLNPILSGLVVRGVLRRKHVPHSAAQVFELLP